MLNYPMACEWTRGGSAMSRQGSKESEREKRRKKERRGWRRWVLCSCIYIYIYISLHVEFS